MRSPVVRIIGAILVAGAVLIFLSHVYVTALHSQPEIHSTLTPTKTP